MTRSEDEIDPEYAVQFLSDWAECCKCGLQWIWEDEDGKEVTADMLDGLRCPECDSGEILFEYSLELLQ